MTVVSNDNDVDLDVVGLVRVLPGCTVPARTTEMAHTRGSQPPRSPALVGAVSY